MLGISGHWELVESTFSPFAVNHVCFCSSCRSLCSRSRLSRGEELVNSAFRLSYLLCLLRSPNFLASLNIRVSWLVRYEDSFLTRHQVLHLNSK